MSGTPNLKDEVYERIEFVADNAGLMKNYNRCWNYGDTYNNPQTTLPPKPPNYPAPKANKQSAFKSGRLPATVRQIVPKSTPS